MVTSDAVVRGKSVIAKDGRVVGKVDGFELDPESWEIVSVRIRVARGVVGALALKKPFFGSATISIAVDTVEGIADMVVLRMTVDELRASLPRTETSAARRAAKADKAGKTEPAHVVVAPKAPSAVPAAATGAPISSGSTSPSGGVSTGKPQGHGQT